MSRITYLSPGTGNYYCGTCLRDQALIDGLRARGHRVEVVPMYLPAYPEHGGEPEDTPIRMGAVNLYLQQKAPVLCSLLRPISGLLDSPALLRWISRHAGATDPALLGEMTLSMLEGSAGPLAPMVAKLALSLDPDSPPEAILLSNALLCGLARPLREGTGARIVCSLQGEAPFLDALPEAYRERAWAALREHTKDVDRFIAVSRHYAEWMRERMEVPADEIDVVWNGLDEETLAIEPAASPPARPTIGYLARMCEDKGLPLLVDAFLELCRRGRIEDPLLRLAGVELADDEPLVATLTERIDAAGLSDRVELLPNLAPTAKVELLQSLTVFCVPAHADEAFGLYVLEANAAGVPVVAPRHAAFPEILERTGGGLLCEPEDAVALAEALEGLLGDPERSRALGALGRAGVREHFTAARMAAEVERIVEGIVGERS